MSDLNIAKLLSTDGFIQYNKYLARAIGVHEAIVLGELCSLYNLFHGAEFYAQQEKLEFETGLSAKQIRNALDTLKDIGIISVTKKGQPCKNYYTLNTEVLKKFLAEEDASKGKLDVLNLPNKKCQNGTTSCAISSPLLDNKILENNILNNNTSSTSLNSEPPKFKPTKITKREENKMLLSSLTESEYKISEKCADLMIDYLKPITKTYDPTVNKTVWQADFVRRARSKNVSLNDVLLCVQYVHDDVTGFEQPNSQSPEKLFKKFDYLYGKAIGKSKYKSRNNTADMDHNNMNTGNRDYTL